MQTSRPKVLFLTAWYPHKYDAMAGLFVRKHAEAISRKADVCVLYLHLGSEVERFSIEHNTYGEIREIKVYMPLLSTTIGRTVAFIRGFIRGYKLVCKSFGKPDITQVNTLTRNGVLALWLKITRKIPYIIVEHCSRYLRENPLYKGFMRKRATEIVARRAERVFTVSQMLQNAMKNHRIKARYDILYNVVDDFFFFDREKEFILPSKPRVVHISCFDDKAKNISGILRAIKILSLKRNDFEFVFIGTGVDFNEIKRFSHTLGLEPDRVRFVGEQTPEQVAEWLAGSTCSVVFSRYETACVALMESLAAGVPVVATPTGIAPEFVDRQSGVVVPSSDEAKLAEAIGFLLDNKNMFDKIQISRKAQQFRAEAISDKLYSCYHNILSRDDI